MKELYTLRIFRNLIFFLISTYLELTLIIFEKKSNSEKLEEYLKILY